MCDDTDVTDMETLSTRITWNNSDDADGADSVNTQIFSPSKTRMGADNSLPETQIGTDSSPPIETQMGADNTDRLKRVARNE
jgi:hypothetical protein